METGKGLDILMAEWKECHQKRGWTNFISDGAVNAELYEAAYPKILFFLKEAYSKGNDGDWSLTEWLNHGAMTRMWGAVAEWTYGIRYTTETQILPRPQLTREEKTSLLQSVAIVNVKKSNGQSGSDYGDLWNYAEQDRAFLKKELELLKPDVIVCGNNSSLLRFLYGADRKDGRTMPDGRIDAAFMEKHRFALSDDQIIIDYYHPANQYPGILNYYTVCCLYQQALKQKNN